MDATFDLERFVAAQHGTYHDVVEELRAGFKQGHWIWFIFPQIAGLGTSPASETYSLQSLAEAEAYLKDPILGHRLLECTGLVLEHTDLTIESMLGSLDAMKFRSSMTLFAQIPWADKVFRQALERYFGGALDLRTIDLLTRHN